MTPSVCNYYATLRCNDQCEFSTLWQLENPPEERPYDLDQLKKEGVKQLNITGGEPLLRDDLPEILKAAKELGLAVELTTNGILYAEKSKSMAGLLDRLYFSLDYPIASEHDRSRGTDCFHLAVSAIEHAKALGEKPIINFTLTRDSVRFLPEMIELAEKLKVFVYLNPVYDFYGTQGFEPATVEHIKYYARRKNALVNLAALAFVKAGGNKSLYPRCRAKDTTVTVMPDGSRVSTCFFNPGGRPGKEDVCSGCMRWPYMLPSFATGVDKYFWLNLLSEFSQRRKLQ